MSTADDRVKEFTEFRQRMNQRILDEPNQVVRRFFALDTQTYNAFMGQPRTYGATLRVKY